MENKTETKLTEGKTPVQAQPAKSAKEIELEKKLAASEKALVDAKTKAEEEAIERVAAAVGIDPASLVAKEADTQANESMEYDLGDAECFINGFRYSGRGKAPAQVVEMLLSMAGSSRLRRLRELVGTDYVAEMAGQRILSWKATQHPDSVA